MVAFFIFNPSRLKIIYHTIHWVSKQEEHPFQEFSARDNVLSLKGFEIGNRKWEVRRQLRIMNLEFRIDSAMTNRHKIPVDIKIFHENPLLTVFVPRCRYQLVIPTDKYR